MTYTTFGFVALSAAMEKASGKDFLTFMKEDVFNPLEMHSTIPEQHQTLLRNRGHFYIRKDNKLLNAPYVNQSLKWAGGGFLSTVEDLLRFGHSLQSGSFLSPETVKLLWTNQHDKSGKATNYGLGWEIIPREKSVLKIAKTKNLICHSGGAAGGSTNLVILPEDNIIVVLLANLQDVKGIHPFCQNVAEMFLSGEQISEPRNRNVQTSKKA